jgi:hypothetical protein
MSNKVKYDEHALTDREVKLSARLMVAEYGHEAPRRAKERIAQMRSIKNGQGVSAWGRILEMISGLQGVRT